MASSTLGRPDVAPLFVDDPPISVVQDVLLFNGDRFDGEWQFGRRHGKGVYYFSSGSRYEGEWKEGRMVGWGVFTQNGKARQGAMGCARSISLRTPSDNRL